MNQLSWFEIPVLNMDRAVAFYEKVFGFKLQRKEALPMSWFVDDDNSDPVGALIEHPDFYEPDKQKGI